MRKWTGMIAAATLSLGLSASAWACNTSNGEVIQIIRRIILRVGAKLDYLILKMH